MPKAVDLVVKNGATTPVDKTFTLLSPAAGDGGVAEWCLKEGTISSAFPRLTASAARTGKNSRNLKIKLAIPSSYTDSVTGLTNVGSKAFAAFTFSVPDDYPENKKDDWAAFAVNLLQTPLVKSMLRDALSAN